jgi:hypothetical protein
MCGAFIAAFTSEKRWMMIKKSLFRNLSLTPIFLLRICQSLYDLKPMGGVRRTAHLAIRYVMASYCRRWGGIFKGLSRCVGQADFSKKSLRLSLL